MDPIDENSRENSNFEDGDIHAFLSRSVYCPGDMLYGSIHLPPVSNDDDKCYESIRVYVAGYVCVSCSKWHPMSRADLCNYYGDRHPSLSDLDDNEGKIGAMFYSKHNNDAVACIFASNALELVDNGHENRGDDYFCSIENTSEKYGDCCTFQCRLPSDLPLSCKLRSCSYSYVCGVVAKTSSGRQLQFYMSFRIISSLKRIDDSNGIRELDDYEYVENDNVHNATKVAKLLLFNRGDLPIPISIDTFEQLRYSSTIKSSHEAIDADATMFMRITTSSGCPVCVVRILGENARVITPGSRIYLNVDFCANAIVQDEEDAHDVKEPVACRRLSACLFVQEKAMYGNIQRVANTSIYDTQVKLIHEDMLSLSLSFLVPLDCPLTMKTDLVEISMQLKLEFTVDKIGDAEGMESPTCRYENLQMDIPYQVIYQTPDKDATESDVMPWGMKYDLTVLSARLKESHGEHAHKLKSSICS